MRTHADATARIEALKITAGWKRFFIAEYWSCVWDKFSTSTP